jgi:carbon starvation protein
VGFLSHAQKYAAVADNGQLLAPAKSAAQMRQIIFNDYVDAMLAGLFIVVVVSVLVFGIRTILAARGGPKPSAKETPFESLPSNVMAQG